MRAQDGKRNFLPVIGQKCPIAPPRSTQDAVTAGDAGVTPDTDGAHTPRQAPPEVSQWGKRTGFREEVTPRVGVRYLW
ncbi:hypothetical protein GCM10009795_024830 [Nocardioides hankookensis]